jgi:hypothetical protein
VRNMVAPEVGGGHTIRSHTPNAESVIGHKHTYSAGNSGPNTYTTCSVLPSAPISVGLPLEKPVLEPAGQRCETQSKGVHVGRRAWNQRLVAGPT